MEARKEQEGYSSEPCLHDQAYMIHLRSTHYYLLRRNAKHNFSSSPIYNASIARAPPATSPRTPAFPVGSAAPPVKVEAEASGAAKVAVGMEEPVAEMAL